MKTTELLYDDLNLQTYRIYYHDIYGRDIKPTTVALVNTPVAKAVIYPEHKRVEIWLNTTREDGEK